MNIMIKSVFFILYFSIATCALHALEPFDNWANPPGAYVVSYPVHFSADVLTDGGGKTLVAGGFPFKDMNFRQTGAVMRGVYYQEKPFSYILSAYLPIARLKATNPFTQKEENSNGIGDMTLVGGWFFLDNKKTNSYGVVGFKVDAPTGNYDKTRLLANIGSNVWRYRPVVAGAKLIPLAPFIGVDVEASLTYLQETENGATHVRKGDRIVWESYAGLFVNPQWMAGLHFNSTQGRKGEAMGMTVPDSAIRYQQAGVSVMFLPTPQFNVLLEYLKDFSVHNSVKGTLFLARLAWKL